jgi:hypothetical protein
MIVYFDTSALARWSTWMGESAQLVSPTSSRAWGAGHANGTQRGRLWECVDGAQRRLPVSLLSELLGLV